MRTVHLTDASSNLKTVIDRVVKDADVMLIMWRGTPNVVVMSQDYFDSLMETVHLLRSPANVAHLERSIAQLRKGKVIEPVIDEAQCAASFLYLPQKRRMATSAGKPKTGNTEAYQSVDP